MSRYNQFYVHLYMSMSYENVGLADAILRSEFELVHSGISVWANFFLGQSCILEWPSPNLELT
jgi:hypothetical protein